jgi:ankyrin repeat protein
MQRVIDLVLSHHVSVDTWDEKEPAVIRSKGCVLGKVSTVDVKRESGGGQNVKAIIETSPGGRISGSAPWLLHTSAKPVQNGDFICLLQEAKKPTIIRLREDHFTIILIAAEPPKNIHTKHGDVKWSKLAESASFIRDFVLVWDWETSVKNGHNPDQHDVLRNLEDDMDNSIRTWNVAQILGDVEVSGEAVKMRQKATEFFREVVREEHTHSPECQCSRVPLLWAAMNGDDAVVRILLAKADMDPDLKDYFQQTPLSWAAGHGHEAVVKLLLATGKVDVDSKGFGWTPLSWAAMNGHEAVVKLLLETGKVDADSKDKNGRTPLSWAAEHGHEAVVKLLLETGKVDADSKDRGGQTPLSRAARNGHEAVMKLLQSSMST